MSKFDVVSKFDLIHHFKQFLIEHKLPLCVGSIHAYVYWLYDKNYDGDLSFPKFYKDFSLEEIIDCITYMMGVE